MSDGEIVGIGYAVIFGGGLLIAALRLLWATRRCNAWGHNPVEPLRCERLRGHEGDHVRRGLRWADGSYTDHR